MPRNTQNVMECAQFRSRCIATSLRLQLDVRKAAPSPGALQWRRSSGRAGSHLRHTAPHSFYVPLAESSHFFFASSSTCGSAPCLQFLSCPPHAPHHCNTDNPLQCPSVPLNLSTGCGGLGHACMPAAQLMCTWGRVRWPLSD